MATPPHQPNWAGYTYVPSPDGAQQPPPPQGPPGTLALYNQGWMGGGHQGFPAANAPLPMNVATAVPNQSAMPRGSWTASQQGPPTSPGWGGAVAAHGAAWHPRVRQSDVVDEAAMQKHAQEFIMAMALIQARVMSEGSGALSLADAKLRRLEAAVASLKKAHARGRQAAVQREEEGEGRQTVMRVLRLALAKAERQAASLSEEARRREAQEERKDNIIAELTHDLMRRRRAQKEVGGAREQERMAKEVDALLKRQAELEEQALVFQRRLADHERGAAKGGARRKDKRTRVLEAQVDRAMGVEQRLVADIMRAEEARRSAERRAVELESDLLRRSQAYEASLRQAQAQTADLMRRVEGFASEREADKETIREQAAQRSSLKNIIDALQLGEGGGWLAKASQSRRAPCEHSTSTTPRRTERSEMSEGLVREGTQSVRRDARLAGHAHKHGPRPHPNGHSNGASPASSPPAVKGDAVLHDHGSSIVPPSSGGRAQAEERHTVVRERPRSPPPSRSPPISPMQQAVDRSPFPPQGLPPPSLISRLNNASPPARLGGYADHGRDADLGRFAVLQGDADSSSCWAGGGGGREREGNGGATLDVLQARTATEMDVFREEHVRFKGQMEMLLSPR